MVPHQQALPNRSCSHQRSAVANSYVPIKTEGGATGIVKSRTSPEARKRAHVERLLARAEKRNRQALRIVQKWRVRLAELGQMQVAETQARL